MTRSLLQELSVELGIGAHDLMRIIASAPRRYKVYQIPKRSGGSRTIAQPARDLKIVQRYLLDKVLAKLPVHPSATGYMTGKGIIDNALVHVNNDLILKMDFTDFFPSIKVADWVRVVKRSDTELSRQDIVLCNYIMFWGRGGGEPECLSIGAPTSPALSNIVMFQIDEHLASAARRYEVKYSRYADDITVSGNIHSALLRFENYARSLIGRTASPKLSFNEEKRGLFGKGQRRMVTGLVLTPQQKVSIGRDRKRLISSMLHKISIGILDVEMIGQLKGYIGFCLAVEPEYVSTMREKYGDDVIDYVLKSEITKRRRQAE